MREVASSEIGTTGHLEDDRLAAFVDGKLTPEERAAVREHLARCPECYAVFAGTLDTLRELQPASREGVVPFPFRVPKPVWRWVPVAAAAALLVGVGIGVYRYETTPPQVDVAGLIAPLEGSPGVADKAWKEQVFRGPEKKDEPLNSVSFHTGVLLVDLRLKLAANSDDAAETLRSLVVQTDSMTLPDEQAVAFYTKARDDLREHRRAPIALLAAAAAREHAFDDSLSELYLPFGKWSEAARLAAVEGRSGFFEQRNNRRFLKWVVGQLEKDLEGADKDYQDRVKGVLKTMGEIQAVWDRGTFRPADLQNLAAKFESVIDVYDPESERSSSFSLPTAPFAPEQARIRLVRWGSVLFTWTPSRSMGLGLIERD